MLVLLLSTILMQTAFAKPRAVLISILPRHTHSLKFDEFRIERLKDLHPEIDFESFVYHPSSCETDLEARQFSERIRTDLFARPQRDEKIDYLMVDTHGASDWEDPWKRDRYWTALFALGQIYEDGCNSSFERTLGVLRFAPEARVMFLSCQLFDGPRAAAARRARSIAEVLNMPNGAIFAPVSVAFVPTAFARESRWFDPRLSSAVAIPAVAQGRVNRARSFDFRNLEVQRSEDSVFDLESIERFLTCSRDLERRGGVQD